MAEYSRLAQGQIISNGGQTAVRLPFLPEYIEISNKTRLAGGNSGVSRAWWEVDMGQGAAFAVTTTNAASDLSTYIAAIGGTDNTTGAGIGTGFQTVQAGLSLQYGATILLGASGGIAKTSATVLTVTTTAAHGLVPGNWVTFQNLYQTTTTGMQTLAGIPFEVLTTPSTTTFTIGWVGTAANLTALVAGGYQPTAGTYIAGFKQILYPVLYAPGIAFPWTITQAAGVVTVNTTAPHNFVQGQEIAFRLPSIYGATQLNSLPDVIIPGSPIYYYVTAVPTATSFTFNYAGPFTAFSVANPAFTSFPGLKFAQVLATGDINTGGFPYTGAQLYPSPTVFDGFGLTAVNTINGPCIQGAYFNNTWQGFLIGSGVAGTTGDTIYWRAQLSDYSV